MNGEQGNLTRGRILVSFYFSLENFCIWKELLPLVLSALALTSITLSHEGSRPLAFSTG